MVLENLKIAIIVDTCHVPPRVSNVDKHAPIAHRTSQTLEHKFWFHI